MKLLIGIHIGIENSTLVNTGQPFLFKLLSAFPKVTWALKKPSLEVIKCELLIAPLTVVPGTSS